MLNDENYELLVTSDVWLTHLKEVDNTLQFYNDSKIVRGLLHISLVYPVAIHQMKC